MRPTLALCILLFCSSLAFAQAPLTNQDIIDLHKAGLSAEVVITKIKSSPTTFDTSVQALQELKKVGVDDSVILVMMGATPKGKSAEASVVTPVPPIIPATPVLKFPPRGTYKHKKEIQTEYDRFKDTTYVRLRYLNVSTGLTERISIVATYSYKGTTPSVPENINLGFFSYSKEWRFLRDRGFIVIADGERLDFGQAERVSSDIHRGSVSELLAVSMPLEAFLKVVNASSLQIRLGYYELPLAPDHYEALKDFASRIDPENK